MRPHRAKMSDDLLEMLMQLKATQTYLSPPSHHPSLRRSCLIIMPSEIVKLVNCTATSFYLLITALLS